MNGAPVLVCNVGGIGDHYLALPAVRAIVDLLGPDARFVGNRFAIGLVYREFGSRHIIDFTIKDKSVVERLETIVEAIGDCGRLVSLVPFEYRFVDPIVAALKRGVAVGFGLTHGIDVPLNDAQHAVDMYLDVPRRICSGRDLTGFLGPPQLAVRSLEFADRVRASLPPYVRLMVVHADTKPEKMWQAQRFRDVVHGFLAVHADTFVLVIGSIDIGLADGPFSDHVVPCINIPLHDSIALVARADFFLGVDSCMLHLADLFRVPTVGLFGVTDSRHWGLRFAPGIPRSRDNPKILG